MPPRLSLRRLFLYVVCCGSLVIVFTNVRHNWSRWAGAAAPSTAAGTADGEGSGGAEDALPPEPAAGGSGVPERRAAAARPAPPSTAPPEPPLKPWFMSKGVLRPLNGTRRPKLFPWEAPAADRIPAQLMHVPAGYSERSRYKKVLVYNGLGAWAPAAAGASVFEGARCPVQRCTLTANRDEARDADAILYRDQFSAPAAARPAGQLWILYLLECPYHTGHVKHADAFNWTATYRRDSDIVAPYERWTYYDERVRQRPQARNYAANKTKQVAWFVSNCGARNERLAYARQLQNHIRVDIYGNCGPLRCPRADPDRCFDLLNNDYKFYLAFENSNCKDYITEKFYVNGLGQNVLPIVMGARPEDYERSAPYRSYIHVDEFAGPKELAEYLHRLDRDDDLYNSYFRWKGTGEFINTYFWCRLCAMLHEPASASAGHYRDINDWWRAPGTCNSGSWRKSPLHKVTMHLSRGSRMRCYENCHAHDDLFKECTIPSMGILLQNAYVYLHLTELKN